MGSCVSLPFAAPCCRCFQIRIYPRVNDTEFIKNLPTGSSTFARYSTKNYIGESERNTLTKSGYRDLFPNDRFRRLYSCEKCMEEAGKINPSLWEYRIEGYWRKDT
jgi:hypothetical protein